MAGTRDFGNFRFLKNVRVPFFKNPQKKCVLKIPPFVRLYFSKTRKKMVFEKIQIFEQLPGSKIPLLAIHKIISHIWEDAPRKVNNDEPDLRFFHGHFWPVIFRTVWKPCFSTSIPRGPTHLGPDAAGAGRRDQVEIWVFVQWRRRQLEIWDFAPLGLRSKNKVFERPGS